MDAGSESPLRSASPPLAASALAQQQQMRQQMRLRRVKSTSRAEEIVTEDEKQRRAQPDKPIHKARDSLFSWSSGFANYEGVMNWAFLILAMGGVRLFLENLNKYGNRVDPTFWINAMFMNVTTGTGEYPSLMLFLFMHFIMTFTLLVERLISRGVLGSSFGFALQCSNLLVIVLTPVYVIRKKYEFIGPLNGTIICSLYCICFLKMWSYVQVNLWCRDNARNAEKRLGFRSPSLADFTRDFVAKTSAADDGDGNASTDNNSDGGIGIKSSRSPPPAVSSRRHKHGGHQNLVQYPDNLTLGDLYYYWLAPTLCYELNFPMMERRRKLFLLRRALEVLIGTNIVLALVQQWVIPSVVNSLIPFSNMEVSKAAERILKLALPNHLIWLTWFYLIFHSFLNTMGEILRFSDREFYLDWWNANNILVFWKTWNLPVHRWCVRHLFKPILRNGYSVLTAQVAVFFFSAFFHEYLVSVPLQVFKSYAFTGMLMQVPLIFVSHLLETRLGPRAGNICVWVSLIIGQPMAIMMYYHDFVVEHYGEELIGFFGHIATGSGGGNATTTT